ncbi:MAG: hypothetical protein SFV21_12665 [Rhodospirillaceae bacterium]|nr:hypothetical protein [Rhodospirillaceae bacterium]
MTAVVAALLFACTPTMAPAQYSETRNTPRAVTQGAEIGVWLEYTGVGYALGAFEKSIDGKWYGLGFAEYLFTTSDLDAAVKAAGGPVAWIEKQAPAINLALARRFKPADVAPPPVSAQMPDQVNAALAASFKIEVGPDGVPRLVRK